MSGSTRQRAAESLAANHARQSARLESCAVATLAAVVHRSATTARARVFMSVQLSDCCCGHLTRQESDGRSGVQLRLGRSRDDERATKLCSDDRAVIWRRRTYSQG